MQENRRPPLKRKKIKNKTWVHYFLLFAIVFSSALILLSYFVELYSPKVDVAIGNNESLTLSDNDSEFKNVDERLKWIQMEDELPTVALKDSNDKNKKDKNQKDNNENRHSLLEQMNKLDKKETEVVSNQSIKLYKNDSIDDVELEKRKIKETKKIVTQETAAPKPALNVEKTIVSNNKESRIVDRTVKQNNTQETNEKPAKKTAIIEPVVIKNVSVSKPTKVFIGQYKTIEEAIRVQRKLSVEESDLVPFTKYINGQYTIQAGSFSDKEKASALVSRLKSKGYDAKYE